MANRYSTYSNQSSLVGAGRSTAQQPTQVSTTTLLNSLHTIYSSGQTYQLDASTTVAVNTWLTAANPDAHGRIGGIVDAQSASRAWEHARRRAEDGCIILGSLHPSTPSLLVPTLQVIPLSTPPIAYTALAALRPFLSCVTPSNGATLRHSALSAKYTVTLAGTVTGFTLALSGSGIDVERGLLRIPSEPGHRAFDVFYYLLTSASTPSEREVLGLQHPSEYTLLNRSATYHPPSYLPSADDDAAAEDFRTSLKAIGIKGADFRGLLASLTGLLKLGETTGLLVDSDVLDDICEDVGGLVGIEPEVLSKQCSTDDREVLIAAMYEALVDWVVLKANQAIADQTRAGALTPDSGSENADEVSLSVVEIPTEALAKAIALRNVFDESLGINAEMKDDGVEISSVGHSVLREMHVAVSEVEVDLGIKGAQMRDKEHDRDRREGILVKIGTGVEEGSFLHTLLYAVDGEGLNFGRKGRFDLATVLASSRVWYQLSIHPTDESPSSLVEHATATSAWSAGAVSRQLRSWRLPEWANYRNKQLDFTADFDVDEFVTRYSRLGCKDGPDGIETFLLERGWTNGEVIVGRERVWMRESAWWEAESMLDIKPVESQYDNPFISGYSAHPPHNDSGFFPPMGDTMSMLDSRENLLGVAAGDRTKSIAPTMARTTHTIGGDYGLGPKGDTRQDQYWDPDLGRYIGDLDPEFGDPRNFESKKTSISRQAWVSLVWALTFWIPSVMLRFVGRMKRPDVRMAWREKVVLVLIIFLINAIIIFWIVAFGNLLCPNLDKAFNAREVGFHTGTDDVYVSVRGKVYDITKFYRIQHSDTDTPTTAETMLELAGKNLDAYFPPPLDVACPGLDVDPSVVLLHSDPDAVQNPTAVHVSGPRLQTVQNSALYSENWYDQKFLPKIDEYYKGDLVVRRSDVQKQADDDQRQWVIIDNGIYDLTDYFYTLKLMNGFNTYEFFPEDVTDLIQNNVGTDVTEKWGTSASFLNSKNCMDHVFYVGKVDFRQSAKCTVNNWILLAFTILVCTVILVKFLAALQLGSKRRPAAQDKFVICQVPAYTEGEDHLRKSLDSLTALQYDNKRKLICVICDGMIVGGGNDRPTPKIVLDILGVDPKIDPPALPFRSVGNGNEQLNYGKVYSGLYEYEGNVVPYMVVIKVGKESEQSKSKPGNRGKRDSQILLMQFLNRVHHRSPMSPLELEMFHQINNIIGVDPELYEYLLMVDADTMVKEDSLNRLVAACANDAKIAGICGETSLENEERSWWTMIQVYEYYISHHLSKAFESLFGSVTCLPGWYVVFAVVDLVLTNGFQFLHVSSPHRGQRAAAHHFGQGRQRVFGLRRGYSSQEEFTILG